MAAEFFDALVFNLKTAEKNHRADIERRLDEIERVAGRLILEKQDKFITKVFERRNGRASYDEAFLEVIPLKLYFSLDCNRFYLAHLFDSVPEVERLELLARVPIREEILRSDELQQTIISV